MQVMGSLLFNLLFPLWTLVACLGGVPVLLLPPRYSFELGRIWAEVSLFLLRHLCRLEGRILGAESLPQGPFIVASKHQSTWDTLMLPRLAPFGAYVLKRELTLIPLFGAYLNRAGMIAVDRGAGAAALRSMLKQAKTAVAAGRPIVIYPEGTRSAPGATLPYHPGVAALYTSLDLPVVPVALNSGLFWGRRAWLKRPGVITLEVLDPIPPGLDRKAFMRELENRIESACRRLAEAP